MRRFWPGPRSEIDDEEPTMNRLEKQEKVDLLRETITNGKGVYLADFSGLTVEKVSLLRRQMRSAGIHVEVAKNRLIKRAVEESAYDPLVPHLKGPTAILVPREEEIAPAKILEAFIKEHKLPRVRIACLDGKIYEEEEVKELAKLPPREILLGMLLRALQGPLAQFVGVLNAPLRDLANVLDQIKEKKGA
ncbi:MAG: 50S ribosomal protein L10 [Candidatus Latescibacteria bacterium]|nr:50S ribosomal protein L10 [Candidatus Latescibacterota bacterium]